MYQIKLPENIPHVNICYQPKVNSKNLCIPKYIIDNLDIHIDIKFNYDTLILELVFSNILKDYITPDASYDIYHILEDFRYKYSTKKMLEEIKELIKQYIIENNG